VNKEVTRRSVIRVGGVIFASGATGVLEALLSACNAATQSSSSSSGSSGSSSGSCLQATNLTRGPYFVDDRSDPNINNDVVDTSIPQRSDIRPDSKSGTGTQSGLPLYLTITVGDYSSGACSAISGAQVHIWHCNAQGIYSDVQASTNGGGTDYTGENFLRGYQWTDSSGQVTFTTVYPGWYSGRTVHVHVKVRIFDSAGNVTTEATTQLFFNDSTSDAVYAANPAYSRSGSRDTLNSADNIYASESPSLLVSLGGSASSSYTGTVSIGIAEGTIFGG
jgi:protocatechuate 3,4-dioxygenase beta subunit